MPDDLAVQWVATEQVLGRAGIDAVGRDAADPGAGLDSQDAAALRQTASFSIDRIKAQLLLQLQIGDLAVEMRRSDAGNLDISCHR